RYGLARTVEELDEVVLKHRPRQAATHVKLANDDGRIHKAGQAGDCRISRLGLPWSPGTGGVERLFAVGSTITVRINLGQGFGRCPRTCGDRNRSPLDVTVQKKADAAIRLDRVPESIPGATRVNVARQAGCHRSVWHLVDAPGTSLRWLRRNER